MKHTHPAMNSSYALNLIRTGIVSLEYQNRLLYEYLLKNAPDEENKNVLTWIRNEEQAHLKSLRQLYFSLTGKNLPPFNRGNFMMPSSYCEGLYRAIAGKQDAVSRSRDAANALTNINQAMRMADISADEMRHSLLYQHLYMQNNCKK